MALSGPVATHFARQADACDRLGSPFTARLCRLLADILDDRTGTGRQVIGWPGEPAADALALRLCGGLHRLVLERADSGLSSVYPPNMASGSALASAVDRAIHVHDAALLDTLGSPPQTNEIARSGMLLPGFLTIARETGLPLSICEIGASAGLNLQFDRYGYSYGGHRWGASPVQLAPDMRGATPALDGDLRVHSRLGCDIAPVDIASQAGRLRLRSYVWADQPARLHRLDGALALAEDNPLPVVRADAGTFVRDQLARRESGTAFVLFHSIMWQYMPRDAQDAIALALDAAGRDATPDAPIAWLRMEPRAAKEDFAVLSLTLWPHGETRHLARCDFHGRWIEWL